MLVVGNSTQRNEYKEDIEPGGEEKVAVAGDPARLAISSNKGQDALGKGEVLASKLRVREKIVSASTVEGEETAVLCGEHYGYGENEGADQINI